MTKYQFNIGSASILGSTPNMGAWLDGVSGWYEKKVDATMKASSHEITFHNTPNTSEEAQKEAVTRQLAYLSCGNNMTAECVQHIYDTITPNLSIGNGGLKGGNYNFLLNGISVDLSSCTGARCGDMNSLHFDSSSRPTSVHLDTANPFSAPIGSVVHLIWDYILGHTVWSSPPGIPR